LPSAAFQTFTSHFDEVVAGCHPELRILAGTTNCAVQAARWGDRPVWGIQPHPEINPAQGTAFLTKAAEIWPHSASRMAAALAGPVRDSGDGVLIAKRFLETPAG
jgi:GMP synthase-like glutamine amidotransferase